MSAKATTNSFPPGFFNGAGFSHNTISSGDHSGSGLTQTGNDANLTTKVLTEKVRTTSRWFSVFECFLLDSVRYSQSDLNLFSV